MAKGKRDAESKKRETKGDKVMKKLKKDSINENTKRVSVKDIKSKKERSHQCIQCLKKFGESRGLTRHIEAVHNKERPHACPEPGCAQKFGQKFNLKRHLMLVHNFEKPFPCAEQNCDKKFGDRRDLKDHYRSAHGAAKLVCGFENCAATFAARRSLLEHKNKEKHISVK